MADADPELNADAQTRALIARFRKCQFAGASPGKYLGRGASSLVFECGTGTERTALKVFDPDFLAQNAGAIEEERIRRQLELKDFPHPNLVAIYEAGFSDDAKAHFLLMAHCEGIPLTKAVTAIPRDRIRPLISQIAGAARHLENHNHVHRDIKPDNIIVSHDFSRATLLDLGVVLPLSMSESHDETAKLEFVGTPRYSPPEFLLRTEENTQEGWRAVTFYQLGAVLHDLIARSPLFADKNPKGRMYYAIFLETPVIDVSDVSPDLLALARMCLKKRPNERLAGVTWGMFDESYAPPTAKQLRDKIIALRGHAAPPKMPSSPTTSSVELERLADSVKDELIADKELFPPSHYSVRTSESCVIFTFSASEEHNLGEPLHVALWPQVDSNRSIFAIGGCAAIGHSAQTILLNSRGIAATANVSHSDEPQTAAFKICTAAFLAVSEEAGVSQDDSLLFNLGHYL